MALELNLRFTDAEHVVVRLGIDDEGSGQLAFANPITEKDLQDIRWYVETYGAHSLGDPDDQEAQRIAGMLPTWGKKLFDAVFGHREAQSRFNTFQNAENGARLLTISTEHPAILALPWELLHDSSAPAGTFLIHEKPSISIRRRVAGALGARKPFKVAPKEALHLLFVISRPCDAGFLDPRADAKPVLDVIDQYAPGRVTCEFLRPPTLDALNERLEDKDKPPVDILHFDGHGIFDREGTLAEHVECTRTGRIARIEEILRDKKAQMPPVCRPNTGYLLFETPEGEAHFVSADELGANLHRHKVALVILSACQSAAIGHDQKKDAPERPMGSVAARLTATGIPSVLAMTHSVLVPTTRALFGQMYRELARHRGTGEALDNARRHLANHPEKYEVQRGTGRVTLKLYDWFLPALYQQGADTALLLKTDAAVIGTPAGATKSNLPKSPESGFFGRKRELWEIERWFSSPANTARRITITGFGGQGKTALALEAGRWLLRTGLFQVVVFVDYSQVQNLDAVAPAVSTIGAVLGESLRDADAVTAALKRTPTLVILDNLEALATDALQALLTTAVAWSEAGPSRVLCTTRRPASEHAAYRVEGTFTHRRIALDGLGSRENPDDALEWCAALMQFPPAPTVPAPKRDAMIELFDRVRFHPLSIRVLAQQFKTRRPAELGERLEQLLAEEGEVSEDTPAGLLASLKLSLDRLDEAARQALPRLGVFQGGAFEDDLIAITGLGDPHARKREALQNSLTELEAGKAQEVFAAMNQSLPEEAELKELIAALRKQLAELPPPAVNLWPSLRQQLEAGALIEAEDVAGVSAPFVRFHPTLASLLWGRLDQKQRQELSLAHRRRYYALSGYLYHEDDRHPHQARAIAWRELPNLLHAVQAALDAGDANAVDFADSINKFLGFFGLRREAERVAAKAQTLAGAAGSEAWFMAQSNRGEQLYSARQVAEAARVFQAILKQLGESPSYHRATTLGRLGRCFSAGGRPDLAVEYAAAAIAVCDKLEQSDGVKRHRGIMLTDKADGLAVQGKYAEARAAYKDSLGAKREIGDKRGEGVVFGQLGTLAMLEGNLLEAIERYRSALTLFQQLHEPAMEAVGWHQLGLVFQETQQWEEAERHFRESARIEEAHGNLAGAAQTWNQLAIVSRYAKKLDAAEMWYRKAIKGGRDTGDLLPAARALSNLASLLRSQPERLGEARQLAEEALAIMRTLDPGAAAIWATYNILADIADQEAQAAPDAQRQAELRAQARDRRRLAREAKRNFAGTRHELKQHASLILDVILATQKPEVRQQFEQALPAMEQHGWTKLVAVIHRILAGEREADALCDNLDPEDSMIIEAILQGLADPSKLADLLPDDKEREPG